MYYFDRYYIDFKRNKRETLSDNISRKTIARNSDRGVFFGGVRGVTDPTLYTRCPNTEFITILPYIGNSKRINYSLMELFPKINLRN